MKSSPWLDFLFLPIWEQGKQYISTLIYRIKAIFGNRRARDFVQQKLAFCRTLNNMEKEPQGSHIALICNESVL